MFKGKKNITEKANEELLKRNSDISSFNTGSINHRFWANEVAHSLLFVLYKNTKRRKIELIVPKFVSRT